MTTADQLNRELDGSLWPRVNTLEADATTAVIALSVPDDLDYFRGHFPEQAVLPGVVQVHWAGEFAQRLFYVSGFIEMKSVKFNNMILPNTDVTLTLSFNPDAPRVRFDFSAGDQTFSSGMLSFAVTE